MFLMLFFCTLMCNRVVGYNVNLSVFQYMCVAYAYRIIVKKMSNIKSPVIRVGI